MAGPIRVLATLSFLAAFAATAMAQTTTTAPPATAPSQPGTTPSSPPAMTPAQQPAQPAQAAAAGAESGVINDANSGVVWMSPTALTPPAGTWSFNDYELFFIGASYSPSDKLALSATTLVPLTSDFPFVGMLTAKLKLVDSGPVKFAAHGTFMFATGAGDGGSVGSIGGALTYCLDPGCNSYLNGYVAAGVGYDSTNSSVPLALAAGWVEKLGTHVKLELEADSAAVVGQIHGVADGILAWYGLRFTSGSIAGDVGFAKPICNSSACDSSVLPIGLPWLTFSYRGLP